MFLYFIVQAPAKLIVFVEYVDDPQTNFSQCLKVLRQVHADGTALSCLWQVLIRRRDIGLNDTGQFTLSLHFAWKQLTAILGALLWAWFQLGILSKLLKRSTPVLL
jgi:hypothetical protein